VPLFEEFYEVHSLQLDKCPKILVVHDNMSKEIYFPFNPSWFSGKEEVSRH